MTHSSSTAAAPVRGGVMGELRVADRPKLLDLFSGAGGAARGYQLAGFHVTGVDHCPQPRYAGDAFIQADAMTYPLDGFACIHASPPCQGYSRMRRLPWLRDKEYPLLIEAVRARLQAVGVPYVIENVEDAPLEGFVLCGLTFGLKVYRHRRFESNVFMLVPPHQPHREVIASGHAVSRRMTVSPSGFVMVAGHMSNAQRDAGAVAMDISWMTGDELSQAIPPAFTEWIGRRLMGAIMAAEQQRREGGRG